jgi:hypothetical protein
LKILFICNVCPPYEVGGHAQLCRDFAMRFAERGHQIQLLTGEIVKAFVEAGGTA